MSKFLIRAVPSGIKFDLHAINGEVIATSEVDTTRAACLRGIESLRRCAAAQKILDTTQMPRKVPTNPRFEIFQDKRGAFRFRLRARNGEIVARSEPYSSKTACLEGIQSVIDNSSSAEIEE
jgi:uncharacterized protein YegP (UPF0339 family)